MKSNSEIYLEALKLGKSDNLPKPNTRFEKYLYSMITGETNNLPIPQSRNDEFLEYIALNGGVGNGSDSNDYRHIPIKANAELIKKLELMNDNHKMIVEVKNVQVTVE